MAPWITDQWATHDAYQGDSLGSLRQEDRAPPRRSNGPGPYVIQRGSSIRKDLQTVHRLFVLHPCPASPIIKSLPLSNALLDRFSGQEAPALQRDRRLVRVLFP